MTPRRAALIAAVPLAFIGAFFAWPLLAIFGTSLEADSLGATLSSSRTGRVVWFTIWQAAASTGLTLIVGLPIAQVLARYRFPGRGLLRALTVVPFVLPTLVVGVAFLALVGPGGALGIDLTGTAAAIIAAHIFFNIAVVVRLVGGLWANLDRSLEDAARSLGASPWAAFRNVTLPLLRPAISAAAAIVFLFSFTSFGTVLVLGGGHLATIEVEIFRRSLFDLPAAAALALLQVLGVMTALLVYSRKQERRARQLPLQSAAVTAVPPRTRAQRVWVAAVSAWAVAWITVPPAVLAWRAFTPGGRPGLGAFRAIASSPVVDATGAATASVGYAAATAVMALGIGIPAALVIAARRGRLSRWFDTLLMLPIGTSAVTLGFGMVVALDRPVDLRASAAIIPIAHTLVALPFVIRLVVPALAAIGTRLREAAAVLGASPAMIRRRVDYPIVRRSAVVAAGFAFVISLGEFGATTFTARSATATIPLAIFRLLSRPGPANLAAAMLLSLGLIVLTGLIVLAIDRLRVGGRELF